MLLLLLLHKNTTYTACIGYLLPVLKANTVFESFETSAKTKDSASSAVAGGAEGGTGTRWGATTREQGGRKAWQRKNEQRRDGGGDA